MNPKIPNKNIPPIIPIRTSAGCIRARFEIIIGLKKLSMVLDITPKIASAIAEKTFPPIRRYIATGAQTIVVPIIGKIPARQARTAKNNALGIPKTKKPKPTIKPCNTPITTCPYITE